MLGCAGNCAFYHSPTSRSLTTLDKVISPSIVPTAAEAPTMLGRETVYFTIALPAEA
jgi:hypothetical protein